MLLKLLLLCCQLLHNQVAAIRSQEKSDFLTAVMDLVLLLEMSINVFVRWTKARL